MAPPPAPAADPAGGGPPGGGSTGAGVLLVHGVGLDGELYAALARRLEGAAPLAGGAPPAVVRRRGYDGRPPTADLGRHLDDLAGLLDGHLRRAGPRSVVVAGVSGGATLALGLALRGHPALAAVVAHESLLGPAAPAQHERISASLARLAAEPGPAGVEGFLRRLVTDGTWASLPPAVRDRAVAAGETVRTEAPGFGAFAVEPCSLDRLAAPVTWTVGRHSPPWRHEAAAVAAGAGVAVVQLACVHTPQVEDPSGFARVIAAAVETSVPRPAGAAEP
ncbi:MAG: alpha/beta hydrolase [Acidimicrobiales bacterium]